MISANEEGVALFMAGEFKDSLVKFREALAAEPSNPLFIYNVARVLDELKNPAAEDLYLITNAMGYADSAFQLGIWYQERGDNQKALRFYQEFLKKATPDNYFYPNAEKFVQRFIPTIVWRKIA